MDKQNLSNRHILNLLRNIAAAYLIKGENRFKIIAYDRAADTVEHLTRELKDIWEEGGIYEVPTFGKTIASNLDEYFKTGKSVHFDEILKDIPSTVFKLMEVPSIGPKKALKLVNAFHLLNEETLFEDLRAACQKNQVAELETFGKKSQQDILASIDRYEKHAGQEQRMLISTALTNARLIIEYLKSHKGVEKADALGSLRRRVPTIGDIDIAVTVKDDKEIESIITHFQSYPGKTALVNAGDKKASIIVSPNIRVDLLVQPKETYGSMLQYFTGSKSHNIKLREYAIKKGLSLSENGIKDKKGHVEKFANEESFYEFLGLPYVQPEIREGTDEIALGLEKKLPKLVEVKDLKGDLHIHSSYQMETSHDYGANSYEEIVEMGKTLGYEYVGFADHNPKTSGLSESAIIEIMKKRKEDIQHKLGKKYKDMNYFIGLEVDILASGELALPAGAIEYVDYLIVSLHSSFRMELKDMTKRVLKALSYPKVKIFGHPTGRLINRREGVDLDWRTIFDYTKQKHIALEINSSPARLDLPDSLVKEGLEKGNVYTIDTDAHAVEDMNGMEYGIYVARRGWAQKNDIMNTLGYEDFEKWIKE